MLNRMFPFIVPLLAFLTAITGIVLIGEFLLFVHDTMGALVAPFAALLLVVLIGVTAALLAVRSSKMAPVKWPDPGLTQPVRKLDLGAGAIVGQFAFFFAVGLFLLFLILAIH